MTAPDAAGIEAALAAGLAAHLFTLYPGEIACDCEWANRDDDTRQGERRMIAAHCAHVAAALLPVVTRAQAEALYAARDALYRGEGPDAYADADLLYGEWLGNRADESGAS